jgi:hypothetical protein
MGTVSVRAALLLGLPAWLAACSGGSNIDAQAPVDIDYSSLRLAESTDSPLINATSEEQVLRPLRNGLRLALREGPVYTAGAITPNDSGTGNYSRTTVQVDGVDEADPVQYDGRYIYSVRPEAVPASFAPLPGMTRNVLQIARTDSTTAHADIVTEFNIEGEQTTAPLIYRLAGASTTAAQTQYLAAVSTTARVYSLVTTSVVQPDRTTVQLLDVRDPSAVSQAWKIELDGWLKASRKIGNTLYLVTSYWPNIGGLTLPATGVEQREANERRIRSLGAADLLPRYRVNGGAPRPLASASNCVVAAGTTGQEAYRELIVITAVNLDERSVSDVACLSTNIGGVYLSRDSLYVAAESYRGEGVSVFTVLHKFGLGDGVISYRATGAIAGRIGWLNASYFMDEYLGDLRLLTTQRTYGGADIHQLTVLRESQDRALKTVSRLPSPEHPAHIGKSGEQIQAVRFVNERAYVVTAQFTDPLYVIDLTDPARPFIAGELDIPGFSTYLQPVGPAGSELLLAIGQRTSTTGLRQGVKVELFDVKDIANPQTIGAALFGGAGTSSEALSDPHALTLLPMKDDASRYRLALPINVYDKPDPNDADRLLWSYSALHLFEISDIGGSPQLNFRGVLQTAEPGSTSYPPTELPNRSVLHDDSVFAIRGERILGKSWADLAER